MSIIHEALKKAQQSMQHNPSDAEKIEVLPSLTTPVSKSAPKKQSSSLGLLVALLIIVLTAGIFIFLKSQHTAPLAPIPIPVVEVKALPIVAAEVKKAEVPAAVPAAVVVPPPAAITPPAPVVNPDVLTVQGIMTNDNHNVALINGSIYEEGSIINGQKILKITMDSVTVEHDGQNEVISIKK